MKRMKHICLLLPLAGIACSPTADLVPPTTDAEPPVVEPPEDPLKPNLVIVMTDEHNFRTLGCYRATLDAQSAFPWGENTYVETPNLDRLASMGAMANGFYAVNPVSSPSRSSFFTGLYPQTNGVMSNNDVMKTSVVTFGESLRLAGYQTAYLGKWHLSGETKPGWAPNSYGFTFKRYMYNRGHYKKINENAQGIPSFAANSETALAGADEYSYATDFLTARAIDYIKENADKPFCCVLSIADPHNQNIVRAPYAGMYKSMTFKRPASATASALNMPSWAQPNATTIIDTPSEIAAYFGMVKLIDDQFGLVLKTLEDLNLMDNTIVVFVSDHGDMLGEHGRDNKSIPYEASAKVPFIIYYKNVIQAGTVFNSVMNSTDFAPTILSLMGVPAGTTHQGRDCSAIVRGQAPPPNWEDITISRNGIWIMAVSSEYKLIYTVDNTSKPVLFLRNEDPMETLNCFGDPRYAAAVKKMSKFILDYGQRCNEPVLDKTDLRARIEEHAL